MGGLLDNQSLYIHGVDDATKGAESCKVGGKYLYLTAFVYPSHSF
jgi:hypothetical protein